MRITNMNDFYYAISYTHVDDSTSQAYLRMRVFDLDMNNKYFQQFPILVKDDPIEMLYDDDAEILTVMHPMPFNSTGFSYNYTYFVQMLPLVLGPYNANVLFPMFGKYTSFDGFDYNHYYVSVDSDHWYYQHTIAPQPNPNGCPKVEKIDVLLISELMTASWFSCNTVSISSHNISKYVPVLNSDINLICND